MAEQPGRPAGEDGATPPGPPPRRRGAGLGTWLPWSLVVVLATSTTWLAVRGGARPAEPPPPRQPDPVAPTAPAAPQPAAGPKRPSLETWPDAEAAVGILGLGYTDVRAYRWSGGVLTGWVEFADGPKPPRRVDLDLNRVTAKSRAIAPGEYSGKVVVARRPAADPAAGQEAWVWVRVEWDEGPPGEPREIRASFTQSYHGSWKPRGGAGGAAGVIQDGNRLSLHSLSVEEQPSAASQWLELRVETDPKYE